MSFCRRCWQRTRSRLTNCVDLVQGSVLWVGVRQRLQKYRQARRARRQKIRKRQLQAKARKLYFQRRRYPAPPSVLTELPSAAKPRAGFADPQDPVIPADLANHHLVTAPFTLLHIVSPTRVPGALRVVDALYGLRCSGHTDLRLILCLLPDSQEVAVHELSKLTDQVNNLCLSEVLLLQPLPDASAVLEFLYQADLVIALDVVAREEFLCRAAWHDRPLLIHRHPQHHPEVAGLPEELLLADDHAETIELAVSCLMADAGRRRAHLGAQRSFFVFPGEPSALPGVKIRIEGPFDSSYSLAIANRETARALDAHGAIVSLYHTDGYGDTPPDSEFLEHNPDLAVMCNRSSDRADVSLRNLYPPRTQAMPGREKLLGPWGWEESLLPAEWVATFNRRLTGVLCMSDYVRSTLLANGLQVPAVTTGLPVGALLTHPPEEFLHDLPQCPRLLHISTGMPRKGIDVLLAALQQLAGPLMLIIKSTPNPHNVIEEQLAMAGYRATTSLSSGITTYRGATHQVLLLMNELTPGQMHGLYRQADLLVAPSRGEGFGLPMAEAMLLDLPVVATGYGGQTDFCTAETAWLISSNLVPARSHLSLPGSLWAEPSVPSLVAQLDSLLGMNHAEKSEKIRVARLLVQNLYRPEAIAKKILCFIMRPFASTSTKDQFNARL